MAAVRFMVVLLLASATWACKPEPCDAGFEFRQGLCWPVRPDADTQIADGGDAAPTFGSPCIDDVKYSDCAAPANVCFKQTSETKGFCSAVGCDITPSLCPAGWTCFDLSTVQPGAPWGCVKF